MVKAAFAVGAAVISLVLALVFLGNMAGLSPSNNATKLTILVIAGPAALVALIALITVFYSFLGLTDAKQALGLPDGSIRAIVTLFILVLFSMLSVFILEGYQTTTGKSVLPKQNAAQLADFIASHANVANLSISAEAQPAPAGGALYNISYGGNTDASDFAKTLMAALETLMTTVVGFYFGARTASSSATSAVAAAVTPPQRVPAPALVAVVPSSVDRAVQGGQVTIQISGSNLNGFTSGRLERGGSPAVPFENVSSNDSTIKADVKISAEMGGGPGWDIVVADQAGNKQTLAGAFTVT